MSGWKGSSDYAFEELVAEMGSAFLCNQLGISATPRVDHAKYLKSWIRCLKDKPTALMNASGLANKSLIYLNELQPKALKKVA
jgi:antirestriction protein ArdC